MLMEERIKLEFKLRMVMVQSLNEAHHSGSPYTFYYKVLWMFFFAFWNLVSVGILMWEIPHYVAIDWLLLKLEYHCFPTLYYFLLYSEVTQLCTHVPSLLDLSPILPLSVITERRAGASAVQQLPSASCSDMVDIYPSALLTCPPLPFPLRPHVHALCPRLFQGRKRDAMFAYPENRSICTIFLGFRNPFAWSFDKIGNIQETVSGTKQNRGLLQPALNVAFRMEVWGSLGSW